MHKIILGIVRLVISKNMTKLLKFYGNKRQCMYKHKKIRSTRIRNIDQF